MTPSAAGAKHTEIGLPCCPNPGWGGLREAVSDAPWGRRSRGRGEPGEAIRTLRDGPSAAVGGESAPGAGLRGLPGPGKMEPSRTPQCLVRPLVAARPGEDREPYSPVTCKSQDGPAAIFLGLSPIPRKRCRRHRSQVPAVGSAQELRSLPKTPHGSRHSVSHALLSGTTPSLRLLCSALQQLNPGPSKVLPTPIA